MKPLASLAGFVCGACGAVLSYWETAHTLRRTPGHGTFAKAECRNCGAAWQLAMGHGWVGRAFARVLYLLPLMLVVLLAVAVAPDRLAGLGLVFWILCTLAALQLTSALTFRLLFRLERV